VSASAAQPASASATAPAPAAAPGQAPKQVDLKADILTVDTPSETYRATGSVRMVQDGTSLLADSVLYKRLTGDAYAEGNVEVLRDGDTLKGDRLSLNVVSQLGEVSNGQIFVKKTNFHIRGALMEKTGDEDYRISRGSFTTCDGNKPSWRFEARDIKVSLEDAATARDAVFYAGDIPLLYTPYLTFPVKRERQSGFLIPYFGHTTLRGFYYDQPYYWAISPSQDATFDVDVETARGVGTGVDYRYIRTRGSEGELQAFGIYDTTQDRYRGELNQKHLELLTPNTTIASELHFITDRSYYRDYGEFAGDYNRQLLESTVSVDQRWQRYDLTGEIRYAEDLLATNNDATLQKLPSLGFTAAGEKLGPLFFSMDSGFINFQRIAGVTGQRLDLHPRLSLYEKPASVLDLGLYAGYHQRFYNSSGDGAPGGGQQVGQADAGGSLSLPLDRVYDGRLRHLMIPAVGYGFVETERDDNMPFFDYGDRVLGQSITNWSLTNVLTEKFTEGGTPEYRDLLYLKVSQGYQFSGQRRDLLTLLDPGHHLTDLMLESRITPVKDLTITADGRFNTVDGNLSTGDLGVLWKGGKDHSAAVSYSYARDQLDYLEGHLAAPVLDNKLFATVMARYSFDKGGFLESRYTLEYRHQCWSVIGAYAEHPGTTLVRGNHQLTVNLVLSGVGGPGPVRAF